MALNARGNGEAFSGILHLPARQILPTNGMAQGRNYWYNQAKSMLKRIATAIFACLAASAFSLFAADNDKPKLTPAEEFEKEIRPILKKHCFDCHSNDKAKADLN